jgi:hypothetical protein
MCCLSLMILWHAPNLFYRLKCESKVKTKKEQGVGACSLAHNTLGVDLGCTQGSRVDSDF